MKELSIFLIIFIFGGFFCGGEILAQEKTNNASREALSPGNAEEAGWELILDDNFDRKEIGENWQVMDGTWKIEDGCMVGSGMLISKDSFPPKDETFQIYPDGNALGYIRMEFETISAVKPFVFFKGQKPKVQLGDMSCFINARAPEDSKKPLQDGYFFQFGGFCNTKNKIMRSGQEVALDEKPLKIIELDKVHKIVVENDMGVLRFFIDGELILQYRESGSIMGSGYDKVGFYFYTASKIKNVKVYVKQIAGGLDRD